MSGAARFSYHDEARHHPEGRPAGVTHLANESSVTAPRERAEAMDGVRRWTELPRGGHVPAAEEPGLLAAELRELFRPLR